MLPEDMQGFMAKIVFIVFATCILCFSKFNSRAEEASFSSVVSSQIESFLE